MIFPTVRWKRENATFVANSLPIPGVATPAALVFPFYGDRIVLAEIPSRGWCIPSGHLEPGESAEQAVRREAFEEAGVTLGRVVYLGYFVLTDPETNVVRHAPTFVADVLGLSEIPEGSESLGRMLAPIEDISGLYFAWDALLAAVFDEATQAKSEKLLVGTPLDSFRSE